MIAEICVDKTHSIYAFLLIDSMGEWLDTYNRDYSLKCCGKPWLFFFAYAATFSSRCRGQQMDSVKLWKEQK